METDKDLYEDDSCDGYDTDEIEYTEDEHNEVIAQLRIGIMMGEITYNLTKGHLVNWFANIQMKKDIYELKHCREYCPNVTANDLIEIAEEQGFTIE